MARANAVTVTAEPGDTLDLLVWRALGRAGGAVEAVLAANPGVADLGLFLPRGTRVLIPGGADAPDRAPLVQLWE